MDQNELINELTTESLEHITEIEADILSFEEYGSDVPPEILNRVFRDVHSIKGGFSFFGYENIKSLSHSMETVLGILRDNSLLLTPEIIEALLEGVDKLKDMLTDLPHSEDISIANLVEVFNKYTHEEKSAGNRAKSSPTGGGAGEPALATYHVSLDKFATLFASLSYEDIQKQIKKGKFLFEICRPLGKGSANSGALTKKGQADFQKECESIGEWFPVDPETGLGESTFPKSKRKGDNFHGLLASILPGDLILDALEIPLACIHLIDVSDIKEKVEGETKHKVQDLLGKEAGPKRVGGAGAVSPAKETLRVKVELLNNLMNLAGELVLGRNQLFQKLNGSLKESDRVYKTAKEKSSRDQSLVSGTLHTLQRGGENFSPAQIDLIQRNIAIAVGQVHAEYQQILDTNFMEFSGIKGLFNQISMITSSLQDQIMKSRMQSVGVVFNKYPRVVRDLAKSLEKEISLKIYGNEVEMDKSMIESLSDPMTHLVRNSIDHGIETPEERLQNKKLREGLLELRAFHNHGKICITIKDDGRGIDVEKVREKALATGMLKEDELEKMNENEIKKLIFKPGFSTSGKVTDISGRGVGMDVVKTNIEQLGGTITLESELGKGTTITLQLPLTLAIFPALILSVEGLKFALPQSNIEELVEIKFKDIPKKIERVHGADVFRLRGKLLPLVRLADILGLERTYFSEEAGAPVPDLRENLADRRFGESLTSTEQERRKTPERRENPRGSVIINVVQVGNYRYGLIVDSVLDNEEIVVKPLSRYLSRCTCYSGSTILGDGSIAMILDTLGISKLANINFTKLEKDIQVEATRQRSAELESSQDMLGFKAGGEEIFALNLAMVSRIEKIDPANLQKSGNLEILKYGDHSIKVLRLHEHLSVSPVPETVPYKYVIVPKLIENPIGILVTELRDVLGIGANLENKHTGQKGIFGTCILENELVVVLNIYGLFEKVEKERVENIQSKALGGKRVLLADDSVFFRTIIKDHLESLGCEIVEVPDGIKAWSILSKDPNWDALITDLNMPGMDGLELTRRIRGARQLEKLPVIALTAVVGKEVEESCREAGVSVYQQKFNKSRLTQALEGLVT